MIAARWAMRLIGLVSTMILARLLAPDDFGLIALALLAYGLLETLSYAGVDLALMRQGNDSREHYDTAWTIQVLQGVFIAACLAVAAPFVAAYFDEPRAKAVIWWIAVRAPIESLQNIGVVAFRKELDFAKEFRFTLISKLLGFFAVVGAALWLRNYWALVIGSIFGALLGVALSYVMHPYRPRWSLARFGEIWTFSQWLVISRVGSYLNRKCDEFIVGGQAGTAAMGSYHVAQEIATLPSNEIVMPVRRAMFPSLARLAGQPDEYTRAVLSSFSGVAAICLFVSITLALVAPELVAVMLGSKWPEAAPLMRWLALFGGFSALMLVLEVPLWVAGRTQLSAVQSWLELAVLVPAALWAVHEHGAEGVAATRAAVALVMLPLMMVLIAHARLISLRALALALWRPAAAAIGMAGVVLALPLHAVDFVLLRLVLACAVCSVSYPALLLALWWLAGRPEGVERTLLFHLRAAARRLVKPSAAP